MKILVHWKSDSSNDNEIYVLDHAALTSSLQQKIAEAQSGDDGATLTSLEFAELQNKAIHPMFPNMIDCVVELYY